MGSGKKALRRLFESPYFVSKRLLVKPNFTGVIPDGYKLIVEDITVDPNYIVVVGPGEILSEKEIVLTKPIDLSEYTKTKIVETELENISRSLKFEKTKAKVCVPIGKASEEAKADKK